jgi:ATP-dependent helicase HrpA
VLRRTGPDDGPIADVVARELERIGGVPLPPGVPSVALLPDHLRITFRVLSPSGREVRRSTDLAGLRLALLAEAIAAVAEATPSVEVAGLRSWSIGSLPQAIEASFGGTGAIGYPALVDRETSVDVVLHRTPAEQRAAMRDGTNRLLLLGLDGTGALRTTMTPALRARLGLSTTADANELIEDTAAAAVDLIVQDSGGPAWDPDAFEHLRVEVARRFADLVASALEDVGTTVEHGRWVAELLDEADASTTDGAAVDDLWRQWHRLLGPGFVRRAGVHRLVAVRRALSGMEERLELTTAARGRDRQMQRQVNQLEERYDRVARFDADGTVRWLLEDLRLSLLAPGQAARSGTRVDEQLVRRSLDRLRPKVDEPKDDGPCGA